jgi:signal transduction histidine kinase
MWWNDRSGGAVLVADKRSSSSKPTTASGITVHELNNKLYIILTHCELLEMHSQLGKRATADLNAIRQAAETLAAMARQEPSTQSAERSTLTFQKA